MSGNYISAEECALAILSAHAILNLESHPEKAAEFWKLRNENRLIHSEFVERLIARCLGTLKPLEKYECSAEDSEILGDAVSGLARGLRYFAETLSTFEALASLLNGEANSYASTALQMAKEFCPGSAWEKRSKPRLRILRRESA